MFYLTNYFKRACMFSCILLAAVSCKDTDEFFSGNKGKDSGTPESTANTFDFSTIQKVDLQVDYSAFQTHGPVRFSIYNRSPFGYGSEVNPYYLDESMEPIFEDFTDKDGKYDKTVTLPAYAKVLYIVTGDLYVGERRMLAEVVNGSAKAVAVNDAPKQASRSNRAVSGAGQQTRDLTNLYNLSWECTASKSGNTDAWAKGTKQVYKEWNTPLGTWDAASGRPSYLMERSAENIAKGLVFTDEELEGLFTASKKALQSTSTCAEQYRTQSDMTLMRESEVSITMLGGNTCWCSTLGYYYYTEETKPQTTMDMNIIMLFPNTMGDTYADFPNTNFNGNVGALPGDVIQLKYYPNIAKGDLTGATTRFPKGTKIGFIMKSNGWSMQRGKGSDLYYITKGSGSGKAPTWDCSRRYNVWPSSTDGLSYCNPNDNSGDFKMKNDKGDSRTAKFGYISPNGTEYAIIGFEDACNDLNYSDVIFALNPANAFVALPEVEEGKTSSVSVWAFEDLWPSKGDYDMNDVVVNMKNEMSLADGKVTKQVFYLTTYRKSVELVNGLAARLITNGSASVKSVTMKRMAPGVTNTKNAVNANYTKYKDNNTGYDIYYLTDYVEEDLGSTYILEVTYSTSIDVTKAAEVEPFLFRSTGDKQLEVHIPRTAKPSGTDCIGMPTHLMDTSLYGTMDDKSDPARNQYFVREGNYPFAFCMSGIKAEAFFDTILSSADNKPIDSFYPKFIPWSKSKGKDYQDWYLSY